MAGMDGRDHMAEAERLAGAILIDAERDRPTYRNLGVDPSRALVQPTISWDEQGEIRFNGFLVGHVGMSVDEALSRMEAIASGSAPSDARQDFEAMTRAVVGVK